MGLVFVNTLLRLLQRARRVVGLALKFWCCLLEIDA